MKKNKLSNRKRGLKYIKTLVPIIVAFVLIIATTFSVTMAYYGSSSGTLTTDIILKTGVKIGSASSISGSSAKLVPSQPVDVSISAVIEPSDTKTNVITDAILRAKVGLSIDEDIDLKFDSAVTVNGETGYWVLHDDGYYYLCAETKNSTSGNTKLLVFNPGTDGVTIPMTGTFVVPKKFGNDKGGQTLGLVARFEVAQGELYTSGLSTRIPDEQMLISHPVVQEVFDSIAIAIDVEVGDIIEFGEFPQSLKKEDVTITSGPDANGYYTGSDGSKYVKQKVIQTGEMLEYYETYGAIHSLDGRQMEKDVEYYFKCEPIEWRVLSVSEEGVAQLVTDKVLKATRYQENYLYYNGYYYTTDGTENPTTSNILKDDKTGEVIFANNYKYSTIRSLLNGEFYNTAFSSADKTKILTTSVDNSASTTSSATNDNVCEDTNDKVYALSYADVLNTEYGFSSDSSLNDPARLFVATDYAVATGADKWREEVVIEYFSGYGATTLADVAEIVKLMGANSGIAITDEQAAEYVDKLCDCGIHWLRSPSPSNSNGAGCVRIGGDVMTGFGVYYWAEIGICPAIQVQF